MRKPVLAVAAATALVTVALPSSAEETVEPVPTPACEPVEGAALIGPEKLAPFTVAAPLVPNAPMHDVTAETGVPVPSPEQSVLEVPFLVDASGGTPVDATRATFGITVTWEEPNGDYDAYLVNDKGAALGEGTGFNPLDGPSESISGVQVAHCSVVTLRIENYAGIPGADLTVSGARTRLR